jgi:large subunit ribosomal protein L6
VSAAKSSVASGSEKKELLNVSRVGKQPIPIPSGVEVSVSTPVVKVKGPKGELQVSYRDEHIDVRVDGSEVVVGRKGDIKVAMALHGLTRSLLANAVEGVTDGFSKVLEVHGVGYRADVQGGKLTLNIGFSHTVVYDAPPGIEIEAADGTGGVQARITVKGIDKQSVGQVAAEIRSSRKPDPYKGKGIRYVDEVIHWKAGKTATA